ncbi:glycosyltransferase [bacterium]|nr:glycosyltransferase [bacterium]
MHILLIPSWYPLNTNDIQGVFFREQARQLAKSNIQTGVISPHLISLKKVLANKETLGFNFTCDDGVNTYRYVGYDIFPRISSLQRVTWLYFGIKLFKKYIKEFGKPDIIHAHCMLNGGVLAKNIYELYKIPYLITEHGSGYARGHFGKKQISLSREAAEKASERLAVSQPLASDLTRLLGSNLSWKVMPNMLDEIFVKENSQNITKSRKPFTYFGLAALTKHKSLDLLIKSFSKIAEQCPDCTVRIGGDGPERKYLEGLAKKLNIQDRISFLGKLTRQQVLEEMNNANTFILTSNFETFAVVAIEALSCGTPVITTKCGGPESIIRENFGIQVPLQDVESLSKAMLQIKDNYHEYDPELIRSECLAQYSGENIANQLLEIYSNIVRPLTGTGS